MKHLFKVLFLLFITGTASAQHIDKVISKVYVDNLIKTLSSDEMEGRGTFTPGIDKAASFIANEFKKIGLSPLKGNADYRQTFYKYKLNPKSITVNVDGKLADPAEILVLSNTSEHISFNQSNSDGWMKLDPEKPFRPQFRAVMNSKKRQLVLVDAKFAKDFAQMKSYLANSAGIDEKDLKMANPSASVMILSSDTVVKEYSVDLQYSVHKLPLFNVAGMIPGKSKATEMVIFSGHYDHLGIVKSTEGQDSIANGADDNASGTSAMIALAKYYKKLNNNERTLIFVAFTAEEIGGYGAKYFSEQLNPDDVVAMFNIEMIGKESKFGKNSAFITGYEKSDFGKILQKNLAGTAFTFHPDPYTEQNLFYRSDNATLAALGVPAHTISTDQIDIDKLYHTVKDEYTTLDAENVLSVIRAIALSARSIVNGTDSPVRIPKLVN